jgi:predicted nucleotidyltransferase
VKTSGLKDVLQAALAPVADRIHIAFIYGSFAGGKEYRESDVDIMVVGNVTFGEIVSALGTAQEMLSREVNPAVYSKAEFHSKVKAGHHFLDTVLNGKKIFLIGGERELARLVKKRVVD